MLKEEEKMLDFIEGGDPQNLLFLGSLVERIKCNESTFQSSPLLIANAFEKLSQGIKSQRTGHTSWHSTHFIGMKILKEMIEDNEILERDTKTLHIIDTVDEIFERVRDHLSKNPHIPSRETKRIIGMEETPSERAPVTRRENPALFPTVAGI